MRPTFAEINLNNLRFNFSSAKSFIGPELKYMAVVKANAYGHGAVECSRVLIDEGADWLCVALVEEAVELRDAGISLPILCLGSFWEGQEETIIRHGVTPVIFDIERAQLLNEAASGFGSSIPVHLKIDTGMGRVGIRFDEVDDFIRKLARFDNLRVEGLMTHFAAADDLSQNSFTEEQTTRFFSVVSKFQSAGYTAQYVDLANSPAAVAHPSTRGNMVRLGGILYGLGGDVLPAGIEVPKLEPVMTIRTRVAQLKTVPAGETIGYSRSFTTQRDTVVATIPIGYADGYPRSMSNSGKVIIKSDAAPVVGRVSMDWTMIDVTGIAGVVPGENVVVMGRANGYAISAEQIAQIDGTISYEITCGVGARVRREFSGAA